MATDASLTLVSDRIFFGNLVTFVAKFAEFYAASQTSGAIGGGEYIALLALNIATNAPSTSVAVLTTIWAHSTTARGVVTAAIDVVIGGVVRQ